LPARPDSFAQQCDFPYLFSPPADLPGDEDDDEEEEEEEEEGEEIEEAVAEAPINPPPGWSQTEGDEGAVGR
jgi:hypothetical protein